MQINLTSWKEEVDQAINHAAYPTGPESRIYWYVALVGNLFMGGYESFAMFLSLAQLSLLAEKSE
jgi:hypothetical protein